MRIAVATGNTYKVTEIADIVKASGLDWDVGGAQVLGGMPDVEENADTFAGNALLKARALQENSVDSQTYVLADDSGLCVDALDGAPGVFTARYAGPDASDAANYLKLLHALKDVSREDRGAAFVCHLCLLGPDRQQWDATGRVSGHIASAPSGEHGFGYDPVFVPDGYDETFAELGSVVKQRLSHRARAVHALLELF